MASSIAVHQKPAQADVANFLIMAALEGAPLEGRWEQLWAQRINEHEFRICCIPFFTFGVALGDIVHTAPQGGKQYVIDHVAHRSGRGVLRFWTKNATPASVARVQAVLARENQLSEIYGEHLLVIDFDSGQTDPEIDALLAEASALGLLIERGA